MNWKVVGGVIASLARDAIGLVGIGLVSYGAWLAFRPIGFIVLGVLLLTGVWLLSKGAN